MNITGLTFDYGWRKPFIINFNGESHQVELVFDAYEGEEVNNKQLSSYDSFSQKKQEYELKIKILLEKYILENNLENYKVKPTSLQFNYDGSFALLCECDWDIENGIAIVLYPNEVVTTQDNFL